MAKVDLVNIGKSFGLPELAVDDLSLAIEDGEFLVILGPSGCGKTTLLRMIAGLETVSCGDIYIDGERVTDASPRDRNIAMVFQNYALYPHMTAFENIAFGLRVRKFSEREVSERVAWASEVLSIGDLMRRRPAALSGGERQRIALGRALVRKPSVFLFDEPLSNLDARLRVHMRHEIMRLHRQTAATAVYVTHDQFEAMTMGDRIALLDKGRLQQIGPAEVLYRKPENLFVAQFIGTPSINLIGGFFRPKDSMFVSKYCRFPWPRFSALPVKADIPQTALWFALRPESFFFDPSPGAIEITGELDRVEFLGGEYHVYVKVGDQSLVMRNAKDESRFSRMGGKIKIFFRPQSGHFFDQKTGARIPQ